MYCSWSKAGAGLLSRGDGEGTAGDKSAAAGEVAGGSSAPWGSSKLEVSLELCKSSQQCAGQLLVVQTKPSFG